MKPDEKAACLIAVRMLEANGAEAWDVGGRQGAVDAMLTLKDGSRAAFEVTKLAAEGALETASLLARDNHRWPLPGDWFWSIEVGSPQDLRRLKGCYQNIILICEAAGVAYPDRHQFGWRSRISGSPMRAPGHPADNGVGRTALRRRRSRRQPSR